MFFYLSLQPTLVSLSQQAGPLSGRTVIDLYGSTFTTVSAVTVGTQSAFFQVVSPTEIEVAVPASTAQTTTTVEVKVAAGTKTSTAVTYTYVTETT
jgi:hypothetical protein